MTAPEQDGPEAGDATDLEDAAPIDLVIVGGGIVGAVCALRARRAGLRTLLIDDAPDLMPASLGNAGHLAIEQVEPLASLAALRSMPRRLFRLGGALDFRLRDLPAWGPWALRYLPACLPSRNRQGRAVLRSLLAAAMPAWQRLVEDLGQPDLVRQGGHIVTWIDATGDGRRQRAWLRGERGTAGAAPLDPDALRSVGAMTGADLREAVHVTGTGQVRNVGTVLACLRAAYDADGGRRLQGRVAALDTRPGGLVLRLADGSRIEPGRVLVTGGVGSGALLRGVGHAAPVVAERGYHIEGDVDPGYVLPPVVFEDRALIATRFDGRLRVSSFVEFAAAGSPPDPRKWRRLHRLAGEIGLKLRPPFSSWMGSRPTLPDYLPAIGRSRRAPGLFYAFGHQHLGLTLSALTGEIMAELLQEAEVSAIPPATLQALRLERFDRRTRPTRSSREGLT